MIGNQVEILNDPVTVIDEQHFIFNCASEKGSTCV